MSHSKKRKVELNGETATKCMKLIDKDDAEDLFKILSIKVMLEAVYPDGLEPSKTRLIFYAIKNEKIKCLSAFSRRKMDFRKSLEPDNDGVNEGVHYEDYPTSSPLLYCIEKNCSVEMLEALLKYPSTEIVNATHIRAAILKNNTAALQQLFLSIGSHASIIHCRKVAMVAPINIQDIMDWYMDHPNVEVIDTLLNALKYYRFDSRYTTINGIPTLYYLAIRNPKFTLEEAYAIVLFCKALGCDINARVGLHVVLHRALGVKNRNLTKALIAHEATTGVLNPQGKCALQVALEQGDDEIFELLLKHGADSRQQNVRTDRNCVLNQVLRSQNTKKICQIIKLDKHLNISGKNQSKDNVPGIFHIFESIVQFGSPLYSPIFLKRIVTHCIEMNFKIDTKCQEKQFVKNICFKGHTILHLAIRFFTAEFCAELVNLGADINGITDFNQCAYSLTMDYLLGCHNGLEFSKSSLDKIVFLERRGINLKNSIPLPLSEKCALNPFNRRFLYLASRNPKSPAKIILSANKAGLLVILAPFIMTRGVLGLEDLEMCMKTGSFWATHVILQEISKEANLKAVKVANFSYLFLDIDVMYYQPTFAKDCLATIFLKTLCEKGFDVNSVDDFGNSIFHYACRSEKFPSKQAIDNFFSLMISLGGVPSIDCVNKSKQSPLYWALSTGNALDSALRLHFVQQFLNYGADFRRKTCQGHSAIHIAVNSGCIACVEELISKSGQMKNVVNLWRKLPCVKIMPAFNGIEEVSWPSSTTNKEQIITPLSIAIMRKDRCMIKALMDHGAMLSRRELHQSLLLVESNGWTDFANPNYLFQYLPDDFPLQNDRLDNNVPVLEYIFYILSNDVKCNFYSTELLDFTKHYLTRQYDINAKQPYLPPILASLIKFALQGKGQAEANVQLFSYLMEHSDANFVSYFGKPFEDDGKPESLLTLLLRGRTCSEKGGCFQGQKFHLGERMAPQRKYFIRMLLQKCSYEQWKDCHFFNYTYHKEDDELLEYIFLTGAHNNLLHELDSVQSCCWGEKETLARRNEGLAKWQSKLKSYEVPTLAKMSILAAGKLSEAEKQAIESIGLPESLVELMKFLDVETDSSVLKELHQVSE